MINYLFLKLIKGYQFFISPALGEHCRFYPSCSEYTALSVKKYGWFSGAFKGIKRIFRCNPWTAGGVDLP